jgi:hypothetical protein
VTHVHHEDPGEEFIEAYTDAKEWKPAVVYVETELLKHEDNRRTTHEEIEEHAQEIVGEFCWKTINTLHQILRRQLDTKNASGPQATLNTTN